MMGFFIKPATTTASTTPTIITTAARVRRQKQQQHQEQQQQHGLMPEIAKVHVSNLAFASIHAVAYKVLVDFTTHEPSNFRFNSHK